MKKLITLFTLLLCLLLICSAVCAEGPDEQATSEEETGETAEESIASTAEETETSSGSLINWDNYTLDELLQIREELNTIVSEKQRQYAIENGNRKIELGEDITLYAKRTQTIVPIVTRVVDDAPEVTSFIWTSSDDSVAKVAADGKVTGVALGDAIITCTAKDDDCIFSSIAVHVILPVTALTIEEKAVSLLISDTAPEKAVYQLAPVIAPEEAYCKDVSWSSSDEAIATVSEDGTVHAVAPGKATITASSLDPDAGTSPKKATCTVTVLQSVSSIILDKKEVNINKGGKHTLTATVFPRDASKKTVIWESSDPNVVKVANGQLSGVACGTATIKCIADDGSEVYSECIVHVIQMVTGIKITNGSSMTVSKGGTYLIEKEITPSDATNKALTWTSSNKKIATVEDNGIVTVVGGGTCTITCTATDGSKKAASISLYVPSISAQDSLIVNSKEGTTFKVKYYGQRYNFDYSVSGNLFSASLSWEDNETAVFKIVPNKAGTAALTIKDKSDPKSTAKVNITISHNAVYDKTSYPVGDYISIMRNPSQYNGDNMSISGRVLQKSQSWGSVVLRVATKGRWDNIFYVTYSSFDMDVNVIEDDIVTIYGKCTGTETYKTVLGGYITIPSMKAEKIILGK